MLSILWLQVGWFVSGRTRMLIGWRWRSCLHPTLHSAWMIVEPYKSRMEILEDFDFFQILSKPNHHRSVIEPYNTEAGLFKGLRSPHEGLSHARAAGAMWKEQRRVARSPCLYLNTWTKSFQIRVGFRDSLKNGVRIHEIKRCRAMKLFHVRDISSTVFYSSWC